MPASAPTTPLNELASVPLFPLRTVLFPGGLLPLQIFEARYMDMISRCLREQSAFLVVQLLEGSEAAAKEPDQPLRTASMGTLARVTDFTELPNGLLGVTVHGEQRGLLLESWAEPDQLLMGRVELLPEPAPEPMPKEHQELLSVLDQLLRHPLVQQLGVTVDRDDARAVASVLCDLLPLDPDVKQRLLEVDDTPVLLAELERALRALHTEVPVADG